MLKSSPNTGTCPNPSVGQPPCHLRLGIGIICLLFLVFPAASGAQQQNKRSVLATRNAGSTRQPDAAGEQLQKMYDAERAAAETGSSAEVEEASQKLAAMALREMGALSAAELHYDDSIKQYQRSLTLQDVRRFASGWR